MVTYDPLFMTKNNNEPQSNHLPFLSGGGEMGELIRSLDWSDNPLGDPGSWPDALKQTVSMMLKNSFPVLICWGPDFIQLYNDAFRPINGESKHPQALGGSARDTYQEIWETIGPMFSEVMQGKTHGFPNFMVPLNRNGYTENCYFDFSYSPIADLAGNIGGVLVICMETTEKVSAVEQAEKAQKETIIQRDRLRHFFLQAPAGICILDGPDLTFELINPLYQQLFPGRALLGKSLLEAVPEVKDSAIWDILQDVYQTGKTFEGNELLIPLARTTDGPVENRYFNFIYQARTDAAGAVDGIMVFVIEVTDMVVVKQKVIESERELEQMLNLLPAHVVVIRGREQVVEMINDSNLAYWDKKKEETIGKPLLVVLPELADQPFPGQLNQVMETGEVISVKESIVTFVEPDGSKRITYVDYSYQPLTDANGQRNRVLVMSFEVSDKVESRKLLEQYASDLQVLNEESSAINEELAASNEELITTQAQLEDSFSELANSNARFKYLIQEAPVAIGVLTGRKLLIESANEMILRIWGKSKNILGFPLAVALPELQGQPFLGLLDDVYISGEAFYGSETLAKLEQDGELQDVYLNFVYQPIADETGATKDILVVAIDVTEQVKARELVKESEQKLQLLADNMSQLAWMADETGYIFWYNQRWFDYTGTTLEEMEGTGRNKVLHPDEIARVVEKYEHDFKKGIVWEDTFQLRAKDGTYRWFLSRAIPFKDESGKVTRWFGTNTDITQERALAQQKDDFISIASHELKTPITSLKASLQLMDRMKDKPSAVMLPKLIDQSNRSMQKLAGLVEELLNSSRLTEGQLHLSKTTFKVSELLEGCCHHVRIAGKHNLVFGGDRDLEIYADEHRIDQVVVNFVNNAVKYAPDSIDICLNVEKDGNMAKISVKDTGPGIEPDKIPHLFSRYYRADYSGSQYSGLGLGLYISAEIVKRHGGQIGVDSELGKGSTFWFTLPID